MDAKEIGVKIVNDVEVAGKGKFEALKGSFDAFVDFVVSTVKADIAAIETEERLEEVIKEIVDMKISNDMIDDLIRLPVTLEWADDIAIKAIRPVAVNLIISTIKKYFVVKFGGADWFAKFKNSVAGTNI